MRNSVENSRIVISLDALDARPTARLLRKARRRGVRRIEEGWKECGGCPQPNHNDGERDPVEMGHAVTLQDVVKNIGLFRLSCG